MSQVVHVDFKRKCKGKIRDAGWEQASAVWSTLTVSQKFKVLCKKLGVTSRRMT